MIVGSGSMPSGSHFPDGRYSLPAMGGIHELALDRRPGNWARSHVVIGDHGSLHGRAALPVNPDRSVERQQALYDPGLQIAENAAAVAFEAELVLEGPDDRDSALARPFREWPRLVVLEGQRLSARLWPSSGLATKLSVSDSARPLSGTTVVSGAEQFAGWRSSMARACCRSSAIVPSRATINSSLTPGCQRERLGQNPYPAHTHRSERLVVRADHLRGTDVASISHASSALSHSLPP